jgi:predicted Zn-dependent protease
VSCGLLVALLLGVGGGASDSLLDCAEYYFLNNHLSESYLDSCAMCLALAGPNARSSERYRELRTRYYVHRGDDTTGTAAKLYWYRQAQSEARALLALNPRSAQGNLWYGTVLVRYSQVHGIAASVGQIPEIRRRYETALRCDSTYALGWYAMGKYFQEMPAFMGGSIVRAESCYVTGMRHDPHLTLLRASYAEVLAATRRRAQALAEARRVLAESLPSNPAEHREYDVPRTERLIRKITGRR